MAYLLFILGFSALESLFSVASIAIAFLALVGVFKNQRWTMIPVTLIAFSVIADSALPVYYSFKIGYYAHARTSRLVEELGLGLLIDLIAAFCCFVSYRYVGKPKAVAT